MKQKILDALENIEHTRNVRILLADESGSWAWGFASPDSDYDVRFIYVRNMEAYLRLEKARDVIELPLDDVLDINGWDLDKTLRLLHKSNPTVFEWFSSPIVYRSSSFAGRFRRIMARYFSSRSGLWHYLSMAEGNFRTYLRGDMVKAKKYFYVLRPVLACRWILQRGTPPPMLFPELMESQLPSSLKGTVTDLLQLKTHAPEVRMIPRIARLTDYLDESISAVREQIQRLPADPFRDWEELDALFLSELKM